MIKIFTFLEIVEVLSQNFFFFFIKGFFIGKELTIQYIKQSMNKK